MFLLFYKHDPARLVRYDAREGCGSKFRCIRSTPTERQSTGENDFECFASTGSKDARDNASELTPPAGLEANGVDKSISRGADHRTEKAIPYPLQSGADSEIDMIAGSVIGVMTTTTLRYAGDLPFVAFRIFHDRSAI
jgi:hypothetical protein